MESVTITIEEAMKITGLGRAKLTALLNTKGCPLLPRRPRQKYVIPRDAFIKWVENRTR